MANTKHLNLYKPSRDDYINVSRDIAENMQKIDDGVGQSVTVSELGTVISGNTSNVDVSVGQVVFVRDSTISGINDGLYTSQKAVPAGEAFAAADLVEYTGGGLTAAIEQGKYSTDESVCGCLDDGTPVYRKYVHADSVGASNPQIPLPGWTWSRILSITGSIVVAGLVMAIPLIDSGGDKWLPRCGQEYISAWYSNGVSYTNLNLVIEYIK